MMRDTLARAPESRTRELAYFETSSPTIAARNHRVHTRHLPRSLRRSAGMIDSAHMRVTLRREMPNCLAT